METINTSPLVSVIIPTHNCSAYLSQAIDSVLNQSFKDIELIVIDDGSTDNTSQALNSYQKHIRHFYQPNQGVAAARNRGLTEAQGELIAFLDADDWFWPQKLAQQVTYFQGLPSLDMVISGWRLIRETGESIANVEPWQWFPELNLETIVLNKPARPSAMMLRRHWCETIGGFDEALSSAEDLDFLLRLMLAGCEAQWIPEILVDYRQHSSSLMSQGSQLIEDTAQVMQQFFQRSDLPQSIVALKQQERRQSYLWLAARMFYDGYSSEMERCLKQVLYYTPERTVQTSFEWFQNFQGYAQEYGHTFDAYQLTHSSAWQNAIAALMPTLPPSSVTHPPQASLSKAESSGPPPLQRRLGEGSRSSPKVLLYSDDPGAGGILQCNHAIASHLAQSGYDMVHLHFCQPTPLNKREQDLGIVQIDLGYHAGNDFTRSMKDIEGSKRHFLEHEPKLIIFSDGWPFSNLAAKQAAITLGIPYIIVLGFIEESCEHYDYQDGVAYRDLVTIQYAHAEAVVSVSQANLKLLRRIFQLPESCGQVIYNGRPDIFFKSPDLVARQRLRQELGIPQDAVVCFTSARLDSIKGYQYQVEAIKALKKSPVWPQLYFVWAGMGIEHLLESNEPTLRQSIEELGVGNRVKFLGQRWDIPELLDMSDIFILSSEAEGMPLSVMEAMAKGLPVVASAVSGIPEELGKTGQLLPNPKHSPEEAIALLANTIEHWARDEALRQSIGNDCRQRTKELFQESAMVQQYEAVIAYCFELQTAIFNNVKGKTIELTRLSAQETSDIQRQLEYTGWIWQAWYEYQHQNEDLMKVALEQALTLKPIGAGNPIMEWGQMFARFCKEQKQDFDSCRLIKSSSWQLILRSIC